MLFRERWALIQIHSDGDESVINQGLFGVQWIPWRVSVFFEHRNKNDNISIVAGKSFIDFPIVNIQ